MWAEVAHVARTRVALVEQAVGALRDGAPQARALADVAFDECHKLVGSLDSYGHRGGSALALQAAELLEQEPPDLAMLHDVVGRLRAVVDS